MAMRAARALFPNGLPNVSYCWPTHEQNEASKLIDIEAKARVIDAETRAPMLINAIRLSADAHDRAAASLKEAGLPTTGGIFKDEAAALRRAIIIAEEGK